MSMARTKAAEMASKPKFYAVKKGHNPGIYTTWQDCKFQVQGYTGNQFKGFNCRTEAEQYLRGVSSSTLGSALLLVSALPKSSSKKAKSPALVKVKRSRSTSLRPSRPSTTAEALDPTGVPQDEANDVYQVEYDGASKSNPGPAGAGALVRRPDGSVVCELREGIGSATNNVAEYRAFILGLRGALDRGIYRVRVQGDSKLVCEQVLGRWKVNQPTLAILCKEAQRLIQNFSEFSVRHVDREFNSAADQLANEAVLLPETKFISSFKDDTEGSARPGRAEAAILGDPNWRQCRESKTYGAFNLAQSSELRLACKSYYVGFRPSAVVGAQWLRSILSPNKAKRALALVARPSSSSTEDYAARSWPSFSPHVLKDELWKLDVGCAGYFYRYGSTKFMQASTTIRSGSGISDKVSVYSDPAFQLSNLLVSGAVGMAWNSCDTPSESFETRERLRHVLGSGKPQGYHRYTF